LILLLAANTLFAAAVAVVANRVLLAPRTAPLLPERPRPVPLPAPFAPGFDDSESTPRELDAPPSSGPTPAEDARALADPERDFASSFRVVLATLDRDPKSRVCILAPRGSGEQLALAPGDRLGDYLLIAIDPIPGDPRGARLRFSDVVRGVPLELTLAAPP
jgi:hypothetical protein